MTLYPKRYKSWQKQASQTWLLWSALCTMHALCDDVTTAVFAFLHYTSEFIHNLNALRLENMEILIGRIWCTFRWSTLHQWIAISNVLYGSTGFIKREGTECWGGLNGPAETASRFRRLSTGYIHPSRNSARIASLCYRIVDRCELI